MVTPLILDPEDIAILQWLLTMAAILMFQVAGAEESRYHPKKCHPFPYPAESSGKLWSIQQLGNYNSQHALQLQSYVESCSFTAAGEPQVAQVIYVGHFPVAGHPCHLCCPWEYGHK